MLVCQSHPPSRGTHLTRESAPLEPEKAACPANDHATGRTLPPRPHGREQAHLKLHTPVPGKNQSRMAGPPCPPSRAPAGAPMSATRRAEWLPPAIGDAGDDSPAGGERLPTVQSAPLPPDGMTCRESRLLRYCRPGSPERGMPSANGGPAGQHTRPTSPQPRTAPIPALPARGAFNNCEDGSWLKKRMTSG